MRALLTVLVIISLICGSLSIYLNYVANQEDLKRYMKEVEEEQKPTSSVIHDSDKRLIISNTQVDNGARIQIVDYKDGRYYNVASLYDSTWVVKDTAATLKVLLKDLQIKYQTVNKAHGTN